MHFFSLNSTQPLVKMSTRNIPGGKGGRCVRLTTSPLSCAECHENLGAWTTWNPLGHTGPVTELLLPLPTCAICSPRPIFFLLSLEWYLMGSTNHEAPHCAFFCPISCYLKHPQAKAVPNKLRLKVLRQVCGTLHQNSMWPSDFFVFFFGGGGVIFVHLTPCHHTMKYFATEMFWHCQLTLAVAAFSPHRS